MILDGLRVFYLHGFASSPGSLKAKFFSARLRSLGIQLEVPDLSEGDFTHLTVTRQLHVIERLLAGHVDRAQRPTNGLCAPQSAMLIGSSLGGYLAALYASRHTEVARLILLAPAFDFRRLWMQDLGSQRLDQWKRNRTMLVFNYAEGREMPLDIEFLEDAGTYEPFPSFSQPALIFHGNRDPIVPVEHSLRFQRRHPATRLMRLDSGHELTDVLDPIWREAQPFLLSGEMRLKC